MKFYHGTSRHKAKAILAVGIDPDAERSHDEGDFGRGFYVTQDLTRARTYGDAVLEVDIDLSQFAYIENPYFCEKLQLLQPKTDVERLFYGIAFDPESGEMRTCCHTLPDHAETATQIRDTFLEVGYLGITTGRPDRETVVFSSSTVVSVRWHDAALLR